MDVIAEVPLLQLLETLVEVNGAECNISKALHRREAASVT